MTGLLVQRELAPLYRDSGEPNGYEVLLAGVKEPRKTRMEILVGDRRAGWTETEIRPEEDDSYRISTRTEVDFYVVAGSLGPMLDNPDLAEGLVFKSDQKLWIGGDFQLREMEIHIDSPIFVFEQKGVVDGDDLHLRTVYGGTVEEKTIDASEHPLFGEAATPFVMPRDLSIGKSWEMVRINPLDGSKTIYRGEVVDRERQHPWRKKFRDVYVVKIADRQKTVEITSFVTPEGELLEQWLPYHVVLVLEEPGS